MHPINDFNIEFYKDTARNLSKKHEVRKLHTFLQRKYAMQEPGHFRSMLEATDANIGFCNDTVRYPSKRHKVRTLNAFLHREYAMQGPGHFPGMLNFSKLLSVKDFKCLRVWRVCGYAGLRVCGYAGLRVCGSAGARVPS